MVLWLRKLDLFILNSDLMLIEFVKGGKKGLKMIYPLIVYDSDDNYNIEIKNMFGDDVHDTK